MSTDDPCPGADDGAPKRPLSIRARHIEGLDSIEAREIGFDFARRGFDLPEEFSVAFREGWLEARERFGRRIDPGSPGDRKLVRLRHSAWLRGRLVDKAVTADYLQTISVGHCPITREPLSSGTNSATDATIDRVFNSGAYAVGNLAVMSQRANLAKSDRMIEEIIEIAERLGEGERFGTLDRTEWARLASLCSLALPLDHQLHIRPLLVWPPPRLLVSNMYPVIMEGLSLVVIKRSYRTAAPELRALCATKNARKALDEFATAYRTQVAVIGGRRKTRGGPTTWHVFEDAWASPLVWQRFRKFCASMPLEALAAMRDEIVRANERSIVEVTLDELAGWSVESGGYVRERRDEI
jgi:hypothetical protein